MKLSFKITADPLVRDHQKADRTRKMKIMVAREKN